ncbi:hypothetical protein PIB30_009976 [Stylosanthes scabra]|uniref:Uncharacterized protein n=1 Tax=Stylosanthes scabra TaxID=79078 RepID=A0ABU6U7E2_9FABA|nr:hypothetical protein [Stylosanthes scabra]
MFMAYAGIPSFADMSDPYVMALDTAPALAPAPQDPPPLPGADERGGDKGGAPIGRGRRATRRRDTVTSCGASLIAIIPGMAHLPVETTSVRPVRIYIIHVRPDSNGLGPPCPCSPHVGVWNYCGTSIRWPISLWDGGENPRRYTLNTSVIRYTSWTYNTQLTRACAQHATA